MTRTRVQPVVLAIARALEKKKSPLSPLAVILAGHNGSGKSTLWYKHLADALQIPLVNADRMMLSILPDAERDRPLPMWATTLRDHDTSWMQIAQKGVEAFVAQAMEKRVAFAMETVFSHWKVGKNGSIESKIDKIRQLQAHGYYVLLLFVGLTSAELSVARVRMRATNKQGHDVATAKLISRFPRTQKAIADALTVANAAILVDNSRRPQEAFTLCRVQMRKRILFDVRNQSQAPVPQEILAWLDIICPV